MTNLETIGAIENARELGYQLEWDQSHQKKGQSGPRYEAYKLFRTFDEVDAAIANGTMKKTDLSFDVQRGICTLVPPTANDNANAKDNSYADATENYDNVEEVDHIEAIEEHIVGLTEVIPTAND